MQELHEIAQLTARPGERSQFARFTILMKNWQEETI
jgi:hypothetical protein